MGLGFKQTERLSQDEMVKVFNQSRIN